MKPLIGFKKCHQFKVVTIFQYQNGIKYSANILYSGYDLNSRNVFTRLNSIHSNWFSFKLRICATVSFWKFIFQQFISRDQREPTRACVMEHRVALPCNEVHSPRQASSGLARCTAKPINLNPFKCYCELENYSPAQH